MGPVLSASATTGLGHGAGTWICSCHGDSSGDGDWAGQHGLPEWAAWLLFPVNARPANSPAWRRSLGWLRRDHGKPPPSWKGRCCLHWGRRTLWVCLGIPRPICFHQRPHEDFVTSHIPSPQLHTPSLPTYELVSQQKCDNRLMPLAVRAFTTQAFTWKG